jgi:hypothetical protein
MLTEDTNFNSLDRRLEFREGYVFVGEIDGNKLGLDLILGTYHNETIRLNILTHMIKKAKTNQFPEQVDRGLVCSGRRGAH